MQLDDILEDKHRSLQGTKIKFTIGVREDGRPTD